MKLKDIKHKDSIFNSIFNYSEHNNRFLLFDEDGNEINIWELREIPKFKDLDVIETTTSTYAGYGVVFNTTHIKLKVSHLNLKLTDEKFKYGQADTRG